MTASKMLETTIPSITAHKTRIRPVFSSFQDSAFHEAKGSRMYESRCFSSGCHRESPVDVAADSSERSMVFSPLTCSNIKGEEDSFLFQTPISQVSSMDDEFFNGPGLLHPQHPSHRQSQDNQILDRTQDAFRLHSNNFFRPISDDHPECLPSLMLPDFNDDAHPESLNSMKSRIHFRPSSEATQSMVRLIF